MYKGSNPKAKTSQKLLAELAVKVGVSQQEVSRFENEKHIPKLSIFLRIVDAVGLKLKLESKENI